MYGHRDLTPEERLLNEAIKILCRDGKDGKFYEAAKERYLKLKTDERMNHLAHQIDGIDWTEEYKREIEKIEELIK